jgi:hypothetical protein
MPFKEIHSRLVYATRKFVHFTPARLTLPQDNYCYVLEESWNVTLKDYKFYHDTASV